MTTPFLIRKYQSADLEDCRSLWRELVEWHRQIYQDSKVGGDRPELYFDKHLEKVGSNSLWVAVAGTKIVGLSGLMSVEDELEIEPLIVSKSFRQKGIGTKLVKRIIEETRKRQSGSLSVRPVARNADAFRFFYKLGFVNLGRIEMFTDFGKHKWKESVNIHGCKLNY